MPIYRFFLLAVLAILVGCKSTKDRESTVADYNRHFTERVEAFRKDPSSVSYNSLWLAYLKSDFVRKAVLQDEQYKQWMTKIKEQGDECTKFNWYELTLQNFWSIKPHLSAQSCYASHGRMKEARYHGAAASFIRSGIAASGDGKAYYSAFEVATWADAIDAMEMSDYQIIDMYLQLAHQKQAIYFIFVVNDPYTGFQKEVYFENNKFIHSVLGVQFPFGVHSNLLETKVINTLVDTDTSARLAKAQIHMQKKHWQEAARLYVRAADDNSAIAEYKLGVICMQKHALALIDAPCESYFTKSASMGYMNANIVLALMHEHGLEVPQSSSEAVKYMDIARQSFKPGEASFKYARLYRVLVKESDNDTYMGYLNKAVMAGSLQAQYYATLEYHNEKNTPAERAMAFEPIAQQGLAAAQAIYARLLIRSYEKGSDERQTAKYWLDQAAAQGYPYASYLQGLTLKYGDFEEPDKLAAYLAFQEAAVNYYPRAQFELGLYHELGQVVEQDQGLALSWYMLCANAGNARCLNKTAWYFREGIAVKQQSKIAADYFKLAAKLGDLPSQTALAEMTMYGEGLDQNPSKAHALYDEACDAGFNLACVELGLHYREGEYLERDMQIANKLFTKACKNRYMTGCYFLAQSYRDGTGISQNLTQAVELFEMACLSDQESRACSSLAQMYEKGQGVYKDQAQSIYYRRIACLKSTIGPCKIRD